MQLGDTKRSMQETSCGYGVSNRTTIGKYKGEKVQKGKNPRAFTLRAHQLDPLKGDPHSLGKIQSR